MRPRQRRGSMDVLPAHFFPYGDAEFPRGSAFFTSLKFPKTRHTCRKSNFSMSHPNEPIAAVLGAKDLAGALPRGSENSRHTCRVFSGARGRACALPSAIRGRSTTHKNLGANPSPATPWPPAASTGQSASRKSIEYAVVGYPRFAIRWEAGSAPRRSFVPL